MSNEVEAAEPAVESNENVEVSESDQIEVSEEGSEESLDAIGEESPEALEQKIEDAIEGGASKKEVQKMIKEFELKVNGKTFNKKLDLSDEEAVKRELQMAHAGRGAMQEIAELKKLYMQEIEALKKDPFGKLSELGLNPDELAELRIQQRIEELKKDPVELEREKMQRELQEARQKLKEQEELRQQHEFSRLQEKAEQEIENEMMEALQAHSSLPNSPRVIKQIADTMLWAIDQGWDDVTVNDVIPTVEREIRNEIAELMSQLPEEMMEQYIGTKNIERMRQKRINSLKKTNNVKNVKKTAQPKQEQESKPSKKQRLDDWMRG